ncbi:MULTISPECIES: FliH/SctL family protein [Ramlibacter]|uniref:Flagellar assembly protein FliH n=1 Tax=Ramlibacter pinisoli TaxID=2682844 RepID=A0A6N8ISC9_9BURK|nr:MULTISPECIES: FliH/SctL family protein [Ramlibacter]MBA2964782.1 hypothetical protein [Ramlibacter sp. CGMCC 1.13660]MVQ29747.1 hypothetical protein [Ramlibacter pinisoli]
MNAAAVLRSVAWQGDAVRLLPGLRPVPEALPPADAGRNGYEEGLRRGLDEGARQGHEAGVQRGHQQGLVRGLAEGRAQGQEELASAREEVQRRGQEQQERLTALAQSLERVLAGVLSAAEDELVVLCMDALCRVVGPALASAEGVRAQVDGLLAQHPSAGAIRVHVHPADAVSLQGDNASHAAGASLSWVADPQVALGGCMVRAAAQTLDARLEVVVDAFKAALLAGRIRHREAAGRALEGAA